MPVTHENLSEYLAGVYNERARDQILEEIVKDDLLRRVFETPEGRLLLDAAVTMLQQSIVGILAGTLNEDESAVSRNS